MSLLHFARRYNGRGAVAANISIVADDATVSVAQDGTVPIVLTLTRTLFTGTVTLAVSGLPTGVSGAFSDSTLTGGETTSTLTLTAAGDATVVTSDAFTITASGSGVSDSVVNGTVTVVSSEFTHYGTAAFPEVTPDFYTPTNTWSVTHTPANGAALKTLLEGGTLVPGDVIQLTDGVNYNSGYGQTVELPVVAGAGEDAPVWLVTSNTSRLPAPGNGIRLSNVATSRLSTPHFQQVDNNVPPLTRASGAHGWRMVGINVDAEGSTTSGYGLVMFGPSITPAYETWSGAKTYVAGEQVVYGGAYFPVYVALQTSTNKAPEDEPTYWEMRSPAGLPEEYNAGLTYDINKVLYYPDGASGQLYRSLQASNTGHTPSSQPTWWKALPTYDTVNPPVNQSTYLSTTTYALRAWVTDDGYPYQSLQASNTNHRPSSSPTYWKKHDESMVPSGVVADRCIFESRSYANGCVHLLVPNCASMILTGSYIYNDGSPGASPESKGISSDGGCGPWLIDNNFIASPAINMLVGGSDPQIPNMNTVDCTVRRNHFYKNPAWFPRAVAGSFPGDYYDGVSRGWVKNIFELKKGLRWLIERNVFENSPSGDTNQQYPIVFTTDQSVWERHNLITRDITFRHNVLKRTNGVNAVGTVQLTPGSPDRDLDNTPSDMSIYQNFTQDRLGYWETTGSAYAVQVSGTRMTYERNTFVGSLMSRGMEFLTSNAGDVPDGHIFRNNISSFGRYGLKGDGFTYLGKQGFPGGCAGNQMEDPDNHKADFGGSSTTGYEDPTIFAFEADIDDICEDFDGGDERTVAALAGAGYNGETPGADVALVKTLTAHSVDGAWI